MVERPGYEVSVSSFRRLPNPPFGGLSHAPLASAGGVFYLEAMNRAKIERGWYSPQSAAVYSDFSVGTIDKAIRLGQLRSRRVHVQGNRTSRRIKKEWIDDWIDRIPLPGDPDFDPKVSLFETTRRMKGERQIFAEQIAAEVVRLLRESQSGV